MKNPSLWILLLLGSAAGPQLACSPADSPARSESTASGGAPTTTGGAPTTTGGASASTGGAAMSTGGAPTTTGGASASTGGAAMSTGGAAMSTGGAAMSTGGAAMSAGGDATSTGGDGSGTAGSPAATGGDGGVTHSGGAAGGGGASSSAGGQRADGGQGWGGAAGDAGVGDEHPRRVLLCDEGNRRVLLVDLETPGSAVWSTLLNDPDRHGDSLRDLQLVGGNRVAVSTAKGYVELDLDTGEITKEVSAFTGVESLRRLPSGNTILGANVSGGVLLEELDGQDTPVADHQVTFTSYAQLRLFRRTPQDTFLLAVGSRLAEVGWDGQTRWEMDIPEGDWVFQGLRLADNTLAVTSGYGAAILLIDPTTKTVLSSLGGKDQPEAAAVVPNFYAGFQVLPNGHFVVTNWEGHGGGHGSTGLQLLEYDPSGLLVWRWQQEPSLVSSLHNAIVLDGLDTTKLHDDVNGVLAPVAP